MEHDHTIEEIQKRISRKSKTGNLRDLVYGSIDGTVTTFAIVSGVEGANLPSSIIVILGLANILADGFSMAAGNYSATKSEMDNIQRIRQMEIRHIAQAPEGEREEVRQIFINKGLKGNVLEKTVDAIISNREVWVNLMLMEEHGVLPDSHSPFRSALSTFIAFVACGMIPLLPYILSLENAFQSAIVGTGFAFFTIGALKSKWSVQKWWMSGFETLTIGAIAASVAYFVGNLFDQ